jgi:two-component system, NarL family, response regulator YdfI
MIRVAVIARGLARSNVEALLTEFELVEPSQADALVAVHDSAEAPSLGDQQLPTVLLADQPKRDWLSAETGILGALPQNATAVELSAAVHAVVAGLMVWHPSGAPEPASATVEDILTPRELEVLGRLAEGSPNKIIAHEMGISEHTVKFHVAQILSKLQAGSRTEAVTAGLRLGIVQL